MVMKPLFINEIELRKEPKHNNCFGYIYCLTNLVNNKKYIGQTTISVYRRWLAHKNNKKELISCAIQKHGVENFKIEILDICQSKEDINNKECYYINIFNTTDKSVGYNLTFGGQLNHVCTEETRAKISKGLKGKKKTPEHIEKVRQAHIGSKRTPKQIEKSIEARRHLFKPIVAIKKDFSIQEYESISSAVRNLGFIKQKIRHSLNRKNLVNNEYLFLYKEEYSKDLDLHKFFYSYKIGNNYFTNFKELGDFLNVSQVQALRYTREKKFNIEVL